MGLLHLNAEEIGDTDIQFENALVISRSSPALTLGKKVGGRITNIVFRESDPLLKGIFSRPRLQRFGPLANRLSVLRLVWRWTGGMSPAAIFRKRWLTRS